MKKGSALQRWFFAGFVMAVLGCQLRMIDSFTLSHASSRFLAYLADFATLDPDGTRQQFMLSRATSQTVIPPKWLGWCLLSAGGVLMAHAGVQSQRRG